MRNFILGLLVGIIVVLLTGFVYVRFGFVDPRADIRVGTLEAKIAMPSFGCCCRSACARNPQPRDSRADQQQFASNRSYYARAVWEQSLSTAFGLVAGGQLTCGGCHLPRKISTAK